METKPQPITQLRTRGRPRKERHQIDNKLVEQMFMDIADDYQRGTFYDLLYTPVRGPGLATAYASKLVYAEWQRMTDALTF